MAANKAPRPFGKPMPEKAYRGRLRNRIYLETDRSFLDSITTTDESGRIVLARELSKEERGRLKKLAKEARKNRGAVRTGKLVVLGVLVAAVVVFNLVFKNRLIEQGGEALLESIFNARADLQNVDFRLLAGDVAFASLDVADARSPMTNLFSLGQGRFDIDTWQLLAGKVVIRDLTVSGLAFGTPRERSGALATANGTAAGAADTGGDGQDPGVAANGLSFASLGLPDTLDARAFVEAQVELLETPDRVDEIARSSTAFVDTWTDEIADLAASGVSSAERVRELSRVDFAAIRSVDEALRLAEEANEVVESTSAYVDRVDAAVGDVSSRALGIVDSAGEIPAFVRADYARVREQIPDVRTEGRDFLVGLVEPYLQERLGEWYDRILLAYGYMERLRETDGEPRERRAGRRGRTVDFATVEYPAFEIQNAFVSAEQPLPQELTIESLSSDPDITGAPTRVSYSSGDAAERSLAIGALIDRRTGAAVPVSLNLTALGAPVSIDRGLDALELESFAAVTDVDLSFLRADDESAGGTIGINAAGITLAGVPTPGSIGELVRDVLTGAPLEGRFAYAVDTEGRLSLSDGSTNLDDRIAGAVRERVDATLAAFADRVETELDARLGPQLDRLDEALGGVVEVRATAEELRELAGDREAAAAALQQRASDALGSLRDAVEAEARARIDAARAEAEAAAREQAERAEAAARAEAERAAAEAESAVQDQVDDVKDRIRLPGF